MRLSATSILFGLALLTMGAGCRLQNGPNPRDIRPDSVEGALEPIDGKKGDAETSAPKAGQVQESGASDGAVTLHATDSPGAKVQPGPGGTGTVKVQPEKVAKAINRDPQKQAEEAAKEARARGITYAPTGAGKDMLATLDPKRFSVFIGLVAKSGISSELTGEDRMTLLAPTDDAFKAVPAATLDALRKDPERLKTFIRSHMLYGQSRVEDLVHVERVMSKGGKAWDISGGEKDLKIGGAKFIKADILAKNGLVHEVDKVLIP
ncbi:MAG: fasciclin domain-containing protein [Fimbriimonadaceae bacterium]|nr:fasciclin domain-containing protein [Fimbriimonadaceae bacterium]QYK55997.1 MAG: fasciclin domain-containing protein [Fimbriimonadaceae bacterium]